MRFDSEDGLWKIWFYDHARVYSSRAFAELAISHCPWCGISLGITIEGTEEYIALRKNNPTKNICGENDGANTGGCPQTRPCPFHGTV